MANRYWLGGNWSSTSSWSATNNGASGASVPTSADNVYWHTIPTSSTYTIDASAFCLDFDWTGASNNPTLAGTFTFNIAGSLKFISAMTLTFSGNISFGATTTGKTITTAGRTLLGTNFNLNGSGGEWTLQDNLTITGNLQFLAGTFNSNNFTIAANTIANITATGVRVANLGSSVLNLNVMSLTNTTNFTLNAGTSTINLVSNSIASGGLTFYNVNINSATGSLTVTGSNTFNRLIVSGNTLTLNLTSGTTQTILTEFTFNGTLASPRTLKSVTAGSAATITMPAGRYLMRHVSVKDITVSGATSYTVIAGTNTSGNTGITFVTKFEMGRIKNDGSFNWYSAATGASAKVSG